MQKIIDRALTAWLKANPLPADIKSLIAQANSDLYYGPNQDEDYIGFVPACNAIGKALDDIGDLYVDLQSEEVFDKEPQGFEDEGEWFEPGDYCHLERRDVLKRIVGRELASHL